MNIPKGPYLRLTIGSGDGLVQMGSDGPIKSSVAC